MIKRYFAALTAVFRAVLLILGDRALLKQTIKPWIFGVVLYAALLVLAFFIYAPFRTLFDDGLSTPTTSTKTLMDIFSAVILFFGVTVVTVVTLLSLLGIFSVRMVGRVFELRGITAKPASGALQLLRLSGLELLKFLLFLPITAIAVLLSLIPALIPVSFVLFSWILGAGFLDVALDAAGDSAGVRLWSPFKRMITTTLFGLPLSAATIFPFGFVLILPVATVGAAILRAERAVGAANSPK